MNIILIGMCHTLFPTIATHGTKVELEKLMVMIIFCEYNRNSLIYITIL